MEEAGVQAAAAAPVDALRPQVPLDPRIQARRRSTCRKIFTDLIEHPDAADVRRRRSGQDRCCGSCRRWANAVYDAVACASTRSPTHAQKIVKALQAKAADADGGTGPRRSRRSDAGTAARGPALGRRRRPASNETSRRNGRPKPGSKAPQAARMMRLPRFPLRRARKVEEAAAALADAPLERCCLPAGPTCCRNEAASASAADARQLRHVDALHALAPRSVRVEGLPTGPVLRSVRL